MEVSIFTKPGISRLLSRFVEMRLHVDINDEALAAEFTDYQNRLVGNPALPYYVIIEPDESEQAVAKYPGADVLSGGLYFKQFLEEFLAKRAES